MLDTLFFMLRMRPGFLLFELILSLLVGLCGIGGLPLLTRILPVDAYILARSAELFGCASPICMGASVGNGELEGRLSRVIRGRSLIVLGVGPLHQ